MWTTRTGGRSVSSHTAATALTFVPARWRCATKGEGVCDGDRIAAVHAGTVRAGRPARPVASPDVGQRRAGRVRDVLAMRGRVPGVRAVAGARAATRNPGRTGSTVDPAASPLPRRWESWTRRRCWRRRGRVTAPARRDAWITRRAVSGTGAALAESRSQRARRRRARSALPPSIAPSGRTSSTGFPSRSRPSRRS